MGSGHITPHPHLLPPPHNRVRRVRPTIVVRSGLWGTVLYLGEGTHQGVGFPGAGLPEGKDGARKAGEDSEPQVWPQVVAQGCHLPAWPRQRRPTGEAWRGAVRWCGVG